MSQCIAEQTREQTAAAWETSRGWSRYAAFIGLDVHKETIAVAVALPGRDEPQYRGEIKHEPKALKRWLKRLNDEFGGAVLLFCYEAGPCGYGLYRRLIEVGHDCQVVAPSLIPKKPGERINPTSPIRHQNFSNSLILSITEPKVGTTRWSLRECFRLHSSTGSSVVVAAAIAV